MHQTLIGKSVGSEGAKVLGELLKKNTTMKVLNMDVKNLLRVYNKATLFIGVFIENWIGAKGTKQISSMLLENTTLEELSLCGKEYHYLINDQ